MGGRRKLLSSAWCLLVVPAILVGAAAAPAYAWHEPVVLSTYGSGTGANQTPRPIPHAGVDFGGQLGDPVLAAADGTVSLLIDYRYGCGIGVVISHPRFNRWTAYCHMKKGLVRVGQEVSRGQTIGLIGSSGKSGSVPHVHFELCTTACSSHRDGDLAGTEDPLSVVDGCFDLGRSYPTDRMVLTFPVRCKPESVDEARGQPKAERE
jgi:murein DD-endopeptidase MepM/ murein hydrolase activator NlpD